jgi:hypothetical protein
MPADFPSSPTTGQKYTPSGGITYTWTGTLWSPSSNSLLKPMAPVRCLASRALGQEHLAAGNYGIIGAYNVNIGGWTAGAVVGLGGNAIKVPKTGTYLVKNRVYFNPDAALGGGRLGLLINGTENGIGFVQVPPYAAGSITLDAVMTRDFTAGDEIGYIVSMATVYAYTNPGHTEVELTLMPPGWEA